VSSKWRRGSITARRADADGVMTMSLASRLARLEASTSGEPRVVVLWHNEVGAESTPCTDVRHGQWCRVDRDGRHVILLSWGPLRCLVFVLG
jgi:hypothetical protein